MSLFLLAISIMAVTLAFVALKWGKAEKTGARLPGNLGDTWPQLDEWEADTEEAITQALRNIADDAAKPVDPAVVVDFHSPKKDRIEALIRESKARRTAAEEASKIDDEWREWGAR